MAIKRGERLLGEKLITPEQLDEALSQIRGDVRYIRAEGEVAGKRLQELQKLVHKAALAFEMRIIRNKILMT